MSNRVLTIEKERAEEKAAAEAARRAALGLPPEEIDPFEKFNKLHTDLAGLVRFDILPNMFSYQLEFGELNKFMTFICKNIFHCQVLGIKVLSIESYLIQ